MLRTRLLTGLLTAALACGALVACSNNAQDSAGDVENSAAQSEAYTFTGDDGYELTFDAVPERIFAPESSVIEVLDALGLADRIALIPEGIELGELAPNADTINTSGKGSLTPEGIMAKNIDLMIATNPRMENTVGELQQLEVPATMIERDQPLADLVEKIGAVVNAEDEATELAKDVREKFEEAEAKSADIPEADKVRVLVLSNSGAGSNFSGAGIDTPADVIIKSAGGINAAAEAGLERYQALTPEGLAAARPDIIVVSDNEIDEIGGEEGVWDTVPGLPATPAAESRNLFVMPSAQLRVGGLASGDGVLALQKVLYPNL